ncbi:META domain-containing protein, partial [Arenimonas sp. GDDSR-1]|uniref:META domain-containing protein n=1 Tax=Arenimonas sp. GDDSR-1 TaxID=2950125 RepID=UPI00262E4C36
MLKSLRNPFLAVILLAITACAGTAETPAPAPDPLAGTRWQLVDIQYMDDTTVKPDVAGNYVLSFGTDGNVSIKADCNMLGGTYTYMTPSGLTFGPLRSTMAFCGEKSLYNRFTKDMPFVRSFV